MYLWSDYIVDGGNQWYELEQLVQEADAMGRQVISARFLSDYPDDLRHAFCKVYGVIADMDYPAHAYVMIKVE